MYDPILCMNVPDKAKDAVPDFTVKDPGHITNGFLNQVVGSKIDWEIHVGPSSNGYRDVIVTVGGKKKVIRLVKDENVKQNKTIDEAISTCDGMFAKAFDQYANHAKSTAANILKSAANMSSKEIADFKGKADEMVMKDLDRVDELYRICGEDYYKARRATIEAVDKLSSEMFKLFKAAVEREKKEKK